MQDAVQTCVYVATAFPPGQDRILGHRIALQLAEKWSERSKEDKQADVARRRITEWTAACETEHQLTGLKMTEFVSLASKPSELLSRLYREKGEDVYGLIEDVAKRHQVDLDRIRTKLTMVCFFARRLISCRRGCNKMKRMEIYRRFA
jgi:hypothetical protein